MEGLCCVLCLSPRIEKQLFRHNTVSQLYFDKTKQSNEKAVIYKINPVLLAFCLPPSVAKQNTDDEGCALVAAGFTSFIFPDFFTWLTVTRTVLSLKPDTSFRGVGGVQAFALAWRGAQKGLR